MPNTSCALTRTRLFAVFAALLIVLFALPAQAVEQDDLLPPEKAFAPSLSRDGNTLRLGFEIAPGYYLYRERISIRPIPAGAVTVPALPAGKEKDDPFFGLQQIYTSTLSITLPLSADAPADTALEVRYQGCADVGVCYPPVTQTLKVGDNTKQGALAAWLDAPASNGTGPSLGDGPPLATLALFFAAGLGMALTACMYPLLPIVSALIAGEGAAITRRRGFALAFAYVQGLALTYTAVGVAAGKTGALLTVWLQQPAVVLTASALLVLMALSMFDVFALQLPSSWQSRIAERSNRVGGGRLARVALMGALSALLVGPCVAPPLALALGYIGASGDALFGGAALYAMALGLGAPLLLLGLFGGHALPRAGAWMKTVKAVFGVVMLALAIRMAAPFLMPALVMLAWAALAIGSAVFLRAFEALPGNAGAARKLGKALGLALFVVGAAQLAGVLAGERDPARPLAWLAAQASAEDKRPPDNWQTVTDSAGLDRQLADARAANRPAVIDFTAQWCVSCKEMDADTFPDPAVRAALAPYTAVRVDVTANTPEQQALLKRYGLWGPPGLIILDAAGQERARYTGFVDAATLAAALKA